MEAANGSRLSCIILAMLLGGLLMSQSALAGSPVVTKFTYDAGDHVVAVTDPRGLVTAYNYDALGQLWGVSSPDTGTTTYDYDSYGRRTSLTRANNVQTTYGYDSLNRIVSVSAGGQTQSFAYDSCTNGVGRLCSDSDAAGSTSYSYTPEGWIASRTFTLGSTSYAIGYSHDAMGHVNAVTYPDGNQANYAYSHGVVSGLTLTMGSTTVNGATAISYRPMNRGMASWTSSNGLVTTLAYDTDGRLTGIDVPGVEALGFSYDVTNRLTGIDNALDGTLSQDFGYDEQSRLVSMYSADAVAGYGYDVDGNRITTIDASGTRTIGYSATSNRLVSSTGADPQSYGYDALGNITTLGGTTAYQYDAFNRMRAAGGMTYYVNPEGQRLRKTGAAGTTYFAPDQGGALLAEYSGGQWIDYLWLNGRLIGREVNGQLEAIHADQLGRPQVVTNASHAVVWSAQNWPFTRNVTMANAVPLNLGFPGQYHDAETGLWHNGFRDYDDTLGRYVESDPIGLEGGINTYAYVGASPISSIDPNGTTFSDVLATAMDFARSHEFQFGESVSAFGVLVGGSLTATGGISVKGISINLTSCGGAGGGVFAGAGFVGGLQKLDSCPNKDGTSTSKVLVVEGGEGVIAGVSIDTSGNGGISLAKGGLGVGTGYVAAEICTTKSFHPIDF